VVAKNVAEVVPAATVTDTGTLRAALLLVRATLAPPVGAACVKPTVQVLVEFELKLAGLQVNDETCTRVVRLTFAVAELPLYAAVMVAV